MGEHEAAWPSPAIRPASRRRFLIGLAGIGVATGALTPAFAAARNDKTFPGDDEDEDEGDGNGRGNANDRTTNRRGNRGQTGSVSDGTAGVATLQGWMEGEIASVPITNPAWTYTVSRIGNYAFYLPTGWQVEEFTDPTPADFSDGFTTITRAGDPEGAATLNVYDVQGLPYLVTMRDFATSVAEQLTGGGGYELLAESLYTMLSPDDAGFFGIRFGDWIATMQAFGLVTADRSSGITLSSYSSTIQIGLADRFDDLVREYFLPIMSSFQRFSGGSGDPTPTPSPTP